MCDRSSRGFSFMAEPNTELQFVEAEELDRTWKSTIRERQKLQEKKIWEDFCLNQDVIQSIYQDDPYQFLEHLPDSYVKELELIKKREEYTVIQEMAKEPEALAGGDTPPHKETSEEYLIPFIDEPTAESESTDGHPNLENGMDCQSTDSRTDVHSDKGEDAEIHSICTVRGNNEPIENSAEENTSREKSEKCSAKKQPDNLNNAKQSPTYALEASSYFEKVKSVRFKINEVLLCIINLFNEQINDDYDPAELKKMQKRANEFSGRFARIYMYQLTRQLNDLKRSMQLSLPFAKWTQFQSQVIKVISLHQNTLQALLAFQRPLEQALCLSEGGQLQNLLRFVCEVSEVCSGVMPSGELKNKVHEMYNDEIPSSCMKVEHLLKGHLQMVQEIMGMDESSPRSVRRAKLKTNQKEVKTLLPYGRKLVPLKQKTSPKFNTGARLSMYSLDRLRLNLHPSQASSKENQISKTDTKHLSNAAIVSQSSANKTTAKASPSLRKCNKDSDPRKPSPNSRKPLMRDTNKGKRVLTKKRIREDDIKTMVETVGSNCPTSRSMPEKVLTPSPKSSAASPQTMTPKLALPPTPIKDERDSERGARARVGARGGEAGGGGGERSGADCDVTKLLHRLCGSRAARDTKANRTERVFGASNAQLVYVNSTSPRPTSTPQLLKILEENIQPIQTQKPCSSTKEELKKARPDKLLLQFNIPEQTSDSVHNYRTQFIQYMMNSPMYANSALEKPWEVVGRVADQILDDVLLKCVSEMRLEKVAQDLYNVELGR